MTDVIDTGHCPTCRQPLPGAPVDPPPCDAIWPTSQDDVLQVRCRLPRGHRSGEHWHPSLWPGTPDLLWESTVTICQECGYTHPPHTWCPRCTVAPDELADE